MLPVFAYADWVKPAGGSGLSILKGTYTDGYLCKYTATGTLLDCNVNPSTYQTAISFGTGVETALGIAPNTSGGFLTTGNAAVTLSPLTGYTIGSGGDTVGATDTILVAIQKLAGNYNASFPACTAGSGDCAINVTPNSAALACASGYACFGTGATGVLPYFKTAGGTTYQLSTLDGTETLTNKTITAPLATLARVDGHAALNLTAAQVSGTVIRNTGQALADVNHNLPQAAEGYNFIAYVGTTLAATNYWRFTADSSPQDYICLDGTCGKTYVSVDTPTMGDTLTCYTEQMSGTGLKNEADLGIGTSSDTSVKNTVAVEFDIAGTGYSKAIAETAPGNDTIPQNKYGAVAFEIGADGTIDAIEASANATGYDSAVLAIAGIPAVAASHTRLGTVTAMSTDAGGFVFGTTALNAANTTVAYTDATVYTPSFGWVCITGKGTWTTD